METGLPERGLPAEEVLEDLKRRKTGDADWRGARTWSLVYDGGPERDQLLQRAAGLYFHENGLNPLAFPSLRGLEREVIAMAGELLNHPQAVGLATSGGTESCLLALKTWRDRARSRRPFLKPEVILATSGHVAWLKGAEYFNVKPVLVPLTADFRMDVDAVRRKINRNTVLIVASAPDYPHGMIDPIPELGALAQSKGVPLHVDACVGGFLLPFLESLGEPLTPFDFRVAGVSSMSADLHKYGFSAKGSSVVLYRDVADFEHQFFVDQDWPGGAFLSGGLLGTRSGGALAAAWTALKTTGREGYRDNARRILATTRKLLAGIRAVPGLEVLGSPPASVFAYGAAKGGPDIYGVADQLVAAGWHIDRLQRPEALHAMVALGHEAVADRFLADLRAAADQVRAHPELAKSGEAAMYGQIARVPLRGLVRGEIFKVIRDLYGPNPRKP